MAVHPGRLLVGGVEDEEETRLAAAGVAAAVRPARVDEEAVARAEIETLLDGLGAHPTVPEETLEAYAILAAMGPTYFWFQWQTLRELAGSFGLAPAEADRALRAMLDGAVRTFFDGGLTAGQVLDLVPVRPLAEAEPQILQAYRDVLPRLHAKLKGT